jgi:peroxiredoxin
MTSVNSTRQYLQQGVNKPWVLNCTSQDLPDEKKRLQGYAGLREVVKLEKRSFTKKLTTSVSLLSNF